MNKISLRSKLEEEKDSVVPELNSNSVEKLKRCLEEQKVPVRGFTTAMKISPALSVFQEPSIVKENSRAGSNALCSEEGHGRVSRVGSSHIFVEPSSDSNNCTEHEMANKKAPYVKNVLEKFEISGNNIAKNFAPAIHVRQTKTVFVDKRTRTATECEVVPSESETGTSLGKLLLQDELSKSKTRPFSAPDVDIRSTYDVNECSSNQATEVDQLFSVLTLDSGIGISDLQLNIDCSKKSERVDSVIDTDDDGWEDVPDGTAKQCVRKRSHRSKHILKSPSTSKKFRKFLKTKSREDRVSQTNSDTADYLCQDEIQIDNKEAIKSNERLSLYENASDISENTEKRLKENLPLAIKPKLKILEIGPETPKYENASSWSQNDSIDLCPVSRLPELPPKSPIPHLSQRTNSAPQSELPPRSPNPQLSPRKSSAPQLSGRKNSKNMNIISKLDQEVPVLDLKGSVAKQKPVPIPPVPQPQPRCTPSSEPSQSMPPPPLLPRRMSSQLKNRPTIRHKLLPPSDPEQSEIGSSSQTRNLEKVDEDRRPQLPPRSDSLLKHSTSSSLCSQTLNRSLKKATQPTGISVSMSDLRQGRKTFHGSSLSLGLQTPLDSDVDIPLSPCRSEGYLRQACAREGYLTMDSQKSSSSSRHSCRSGSLEFLYHIDREDEKSLDDVVPLDHPLLPPRLPSRNPSSVSSKSTFGGSSKSLQRLETVVPIDQSFIDVQTRSDPLEYDAYTTSICEDEPLYQIYHQGAVVRDVLDQQEDDESGESEYYSAQEFVEHARSRMDSILKSGSCHGMREIDRAAAIKSLTSLESAAKSGTGFRKMWCEMPKVKQCRILDHMSNDEKRLQESLFEVISSEASYFKSLNILTCHFMGNLSIDLDRGAMLSKLDFNWLFSNVKAVRDASAKMLQALEGLWEAGCVLNAISMCAVIADIAKENYHVYVTYCSNAIYQNRKLRELMDKKEDFRYAVTRLENVPDCHSLPLSSFLALPMQRITRMPLLMNTVCRYLRSDEASCPEVTRCLQVLQKIVRQCNDGARKMAHLEQMMDIHKTLDYARCAKNLALISQSRYLVKKGPLVQHNIQTSGLLKKCKKPLFFFLFNDLLLITKKKSETKYEVLEHSPRSNVYAEIINDEEVPKWLPNGVPSSCKNLFCMVLLDSRREFVLSCNSQSEQTRWVQAVTPREQNNGNEVVYEDWDCPQVQCVIPYPSDEPDELVLEVSDVVNVLRKIGDGWFEGERIRDGERGWFPARHTVEIQSAHIRSRNLRQQYQYMRKTGDSLSPPV